MAQKVLRTDQGELMKKAMAPVTCNKFRLKSDINPVLEKYDEYLAKLFGFRGVKA